MFSAKAVKLFLVGLKVNQTPDGLKVSALSPLAHGCSNIKPFLPKFEEINNCNLLRIWP